MTVHLTDLVHAVRARRLSQYAKGGNLYLVDVGRLVAIPASSPADAYAGARSCRPHSLPEAELVRHYLEQAAASPRVYRVDSDGNVIAEIA